VVGWERGGGGGRRVEGDGLREGGKCVMEIGQANESDVDGMPAHETHRVVKSSVIANVFEQA
jgi:hypothetical protein